MSHNGDPNQTRPDIWTVPSTNTWTKGDKTTIYTLDIFNDEGLTQKRNLTGEQIFIIISTDFPYNEDWTVEITDKVTDAVNGHIESTFPANAVNRIGEFKVETYIDGTPRLYSHHIDFNLVN